LEIRDRNTHVPALAVSIEGADGYVARRAGFDSRMIYLVMLATQKACYDPYNWDNPRTMGNAHRYIEEHFDELQDGSVVDVEFILGETPTPKISESVAHPL
jgi:hypothetical protein